MQRLVISLVKIALASLMAGVVLSFLGITVESLLAFAGTTPERLEEALWSAAGWAAPKIALGAIFVVPVWLVIFMFLPARD